MIGDYSIRLILSSSPKFSTIGTISRSMENYNLLISVHKYTVPLLQPHLKRRTITVHDRNIKKDPKLTKIKRAKNIHYNSNSIRINNLTQSTTIPTNRDRGSYPQDFPTVILFVGKRSHTFSFLYHPRF